MRFDPWSFYQVIAFDRRGNEVYFDRPRSFGHFLVLFGHGVVRLSRRGHRTYFKAGPFSVRLRCNKLPWRPY